MPAAAAGAAIVSAGAGLMQANASNKAAKAASKGADAQAQVAAEQVALAREQWDRYLQIYAPLEEQLAYEIGGIVPQRQAPDAASGSAASSASSASAQVSARTGRTPQQDAELDALVNRYYEGGAMMAPSDRAQARETLAVELGYPSLYGPALGSASASAPQASAPAPTAPGALPSHITTGRTLARLSGQDEMRRAAADVRQGFGQAADIEHRQMARYGLSPDAGRFGARLTERALAEGAAMAGAQTQAREGAYQRSLANRMRMLDTGRGIPSTVGSMLSGASGSYGGIGASQAGLAKAYGEAASGNIGAAMDYFKQFHQRPNGSGLNTIAAGTDTWGAYGMNNSAGLADNPWNGGNGFGYTGW